MFVRKKVLRRQNAPLHKTAIVKAEYGICLKIFFNYYKILSQRFSNYPCTYTRFFSNIETDININYYCSKIIIINENYFWIVLLCILQIKRINRVINYRNILKLIYKQNQTILITVPIRFIMSSIKDL